MTSVASALPPAAAGHDLDVFDCHCHVASSAFVPKLFFRGIAAAMKSNPELSRRPMTEEWIMKMTMAQYADHQADALVAEMDASEIGRTVLLLPDFTYIEKMDLSIEQMIERHALILERHAGRFVLFCGLDPRWPDAELRFRRCVEQFPVAGLKIYPPCGYSPSDASLFPLYEVCAEFGLPVLLHTGPTVPTLRHDFAMPWLIDEAAMRFPSVDFILAHAAINYTDIAINLCAYRPNVYMDTGGFLGAIVPGGYKAHLSALFKCNINHKILFGTDWPVFRSQGGQTHAMRDFCGESGPLQGLPARDVAGLMGGNLMRLLEKRRVAGRAA